MTTCNLQWHLVLLNFMTCGLEICMAAGITYVPPLLLEAGVEEQYMTMVLGIGPVLGLIFVPLIGSASDNCHSSYGQRRPLIWLLSFGVLLSLFIIPHADSLASYFSYRGKSVHIFFLIFGVALLDCCVQFCYTPLEALLSDLYHDNGGYNQAFAMFSFMISIGGCIGYLMTSVNWKHTYISLYLGGEEDCIFLILTLIFVISVIVTMKTSEEPVYSTPQVMEQKSSITSVSILRCCYIPKWKTHSWKCNPLFCLLSMLWSVTPRIYDSYCRIPKVMKHLCAAQLCSCMAVMPFMLFYTDFVGEGLYKGIPSAVPGTESRLRYDEGIRMGSLGLFLQCATSTFFSMIMNKLTKHFGSKRIYIASLVTFTSSALVICLSQNIVIVTIMSSLTGFAYATLQTVPYTLICLYHTEKDVFMPRVKECKSPNRNTVTKEAVYFSPNKPFSHQDSTLNLHSKEERIYIPQEMENYINCQEFYCNNNLKQDSGKKEPSKDNYTKRGIGLDFATLDSTFLLSQILPSLCMGMIVQFMESVTVYIASSVVFGMFAIYFANRVVFDQKDLHT